MSSNYFYCINHIIAGISFQREINFKNGQCCLYCDLNIPNGKSKESVNLGSHLFIYFLTSWIVFIWQTQVTLSFVSFVFDSVWSLESSVSSWGISLSLCPAEGGCFYFCQVVFLCGEPADIWQRPTPCSPLNFCIAANTFDLMPAAAAARWGIRWKVLTE